MFKIEPDSFWPDQAGGAGTIQRGQVTVQIGAQRNRVVAYRATLAKGAAIVAIGLTVHKPKLGRRLGFITHWLATGRDVAGWRPGEGGGRAIAFGPALRGWRRDAA